MDIKSGITQKLQKKLNMKQNTRTKYILKPKIIKKTLQKELYPINTILRKDYQNIKLNKEQRIFTAVYQINTTVYKPFLEYTLFKYTEKESEDILIFPFEKPNEKLTPLKIALKIKKKIKKEKSKLMGFLLNDMGAFFFFQDELAKNMLELKKRNSQKWWVTIDEICNHRNILNFPIHQSVTTIFYQFPTLIYLYNKNEKIEIPIISYLGDNMKYLPWVSVFGRRNKWEKIYANTKARYGPFFYFSGYNKAIRYACYNFVAGPPTWQAERFPPWKLAKKMSIKKKKDPGILRILLFLGKTKVLSNLPEDLDIHVSNDKIYENLIDNTLSWTKNYNSLIIGRIPLSKESIYYNSYTAIVKKFKQHHVLSVHQIDQKNLPKFFDPTYNKYFIK